MNWLEQQVRKSRLLEVLAALAFVAAVIGIAAYKSRYLENVYRGPYTIAIDEIAAAKSADDLARYWVRLTPAQVADTGVDHISVRRRRGVETGRSVSGHFWVGKVGERILFIEARGAPLRPGQVLTGHLTDTPQDIASHLMKGLPPQLHDKVLPVMLDLGDFERDASIGLWAGGAAVLGATLWAGFALVGALNPLRHRALRRLAASGTSIADASTAIVGDLGAGNSMKMGPYRITRGYAIKTGWKFDLQPLSELLWVYPIVISKKLYYVIPAGKSYQVAMHFVDKQITAKLAKDAPERMIPLLASLAPWALFGHSAEVEAAWKRQRPQLAALVAERRAEALAAQPAAHASSRAEG